MILRRKRSERSKVECFRLVTVLEEEDEEEEEEEAPRRRPTRRAASAAKQRTADMMDTS